jgi:hypothetical protein
VLGLGTCSRQDNCRGPGTTDYCHPHEGKLVQLSTYLWLIRWNATSEDLNICFSIMSSIVTHRDQRVYFFISSRIITKASVRQGNILWLTGFSTHAAHYRLKKACLVKQSHMWGSGWDVLHIDIANLKELGFGVSWQVSRGSCNGISYLCNLCCNSNAHRLRCTAGCTYACVCLALHVMVGVVHMFLCHMHSSHVWFTWWSDVWFTWSGSHVHMEPVWFTWSGNRSGHILIRVHACLPSHTSVTSVMWAYLHPVHVDHVFYFTCILLLYCLYVHVLPCRH